MKNGALALALSLIVFVLASLGFSRGVMVNKALRVSTTETQNPTPAPTQMPTAVAIPTPWPGAVLEDPIAQLKALLLPVGVSVVESKLIRVYDVRTYRILRIEWKSYKDAPDLVDYDSKEFQHIKELKLLDSTVRDGTLQPHRMASISMDEIFVAGVNEHSELLWWTRIPDARLVRSEWPDSEGHLQGKRFHRSKVEILVSAPENEEIVELRFYLPQPIAAGLILEPLYTVPFNEKKKDKN